MKKWLSVVLSAAVALGAIVHVFQFNQARKARFSVDVLQRYLTALELIAGQKVLSWSDLPDFDIISPEYSLQLKSADLKKSPIQNGYAFDMQWNGQDKYVISASPVGVLSPRIEYGITEKGILRENRNDVDPLPDTYHEVVLWTPIDRIEQIRTKNVPAYLRD